VTIRLLAFLCVDTVQFRRFLGHEDTHMYVRRPAVQHRGDSDLAEQVDPVGGLRDPDGFQVRRRAERREIFVGEMLYGGEVLGFVFYVGEFV
jgi:hypothetical protein